MENSDKTGPGYDPVMCKIMLSGARITADMLEQKSARKRGTYRAGASEEVDGWRKALPPETMNTAEAIWKIGAGAVQELYIIWHMTGVMEPLKMIDGTLFTILDEVMNEIIENSGFQI